MGTDVGLVSCLVDRVATRLSYHAGAKNETIHGDDILHITRATLVDISKIALGTTLSAIFGVLESLVHPFSGISSHPDHVVSAELYLISLAADCCSANWAHAATYDNVNTVPSSLDEELVCRFFDTIQCLVEPIPEDFALPAQTLLGEISQHNVKVPLSTGAGLFSQEGSSSEAGHSSESLSELDASLKTMIEFITLTSWPSAFNYVKNVLYSVRTTIVADASAEVPSLPHNSERSALIVLRLLSFFRVDGSQLGLLIQEICSSYLHFRKRHQNTVAIAVPLTISRWIDRDPYEFLQLHLFHKKLDGSADTLFDMTQTVIDSGRRKAILYPMQTTLLLLLPDVFEVASNLREAKGNSVMKKVVFLDGLRKAVKNGNEQAGYCLMALLRAARHFDAETDAALVSYAMDVQDEVRDAVFRPSFSLSTGPQFHQTMITAALVTVAHLNPAGGIDTLVENCMASSSLKTFKLAVVQACCYFARQYQRSPGQPNVLLSAGLNPIRSHFKAEVNSAINLQTQLNDSDSTMICSILEFLEAYPTCILDELSDESSAREFFRTLLICVISEHEATRNAATEVVNKLFNEHAETCRKVNSWCRSEKEGLQAEIWSISSRVLNEICDQLTENGNVAGFANLGSYLQCRFGLLKHIPALCNIPDEETTVADVTTKLETVLLVSLCSSSIDVCQLVIRCINTFLQECYWIDQHGEASKPVASVMHNADIFRELSSPAFRFTGLVAFQKRTRHLLRTMQSPTVGILRAWENAFHEWTHLSKEVSTTAFDIKNDKMLVQWRNMSGFLASLGGICVRRQPAMLDDTPPETLQWIDELASEDFEEPLLTRFLKLSLQLLACSNVKVREAMRETLSSEVSPVLYQPLFKALESELEVLITGALAPIDKTQNSEVVFAEQAVSLLKTLVERLESPSDSLTISSIHLGVLALNFAKFIDAFTDGTDQLRVKIRVCQLCEAMSRRKEHLNLRDDTRIRNQLLEYIFGWMTPPLSPDMDLNAMNSRQAETHRMQKDLDRASLRALTYVTVRLPLQPPESQTDAGMSEMKSQMFHTYFNRFLSLLNHDSFDSNRLDSPPSATTRDEQTSNAELAISVLSNLLSANIDVGLKHSLNIGYHDNVDIRAAFVKVLYNILTQGTEFSSLTDAAVSEKYDQLMNLLTKDLSIAVSMSVICPSTEIDELSISLLTVFEQRGLTFDLFEALIKQEISQTETEAEILRRSCVATKMLSVYAKWKGFAYLRTTLQTTLERLVMTSQDLNLELDPARVSTSEELQKNAVQLQIVAKVFIDNICTSSSNIPPSLRRICNIIYEAVLPRFPNAKYTAVGAFIFLRFFCPAIVAPDAEGIVSAPPSKAMRRGLLLITKIIQNMANNVLFGTKEPYMFPVNPFLVQHIHSITSFLHDISAPPNQIEKNMSTGLYDFGSCVALHRYLYDHWDHLRQILTSRERSEYVHSGDHPQRRSPAIEPLRNLITSLGPAPLAISWNRPQISSNNPPIYSRFQNFMLRNAFKNSESFLTSRAVYDGGESKDGISIVCIILRYIEAESIDHDTLLFCYLKIASRLWHEPFGLLIDATCYNGRNEPSDEFLKALDHLTPTEMSINLSRIYVYNTNSVFKRCLRHLLKVSTRNETSVFHPKNVDYHLIGSLQDLQMHFHLSQLHLPKETISVINDTRHMFQQVTRLSKSKGRVEVVIKIGGQFVQITTTKKQEVLSGFRLSTIINDIFRLSEVDEATTIIQPEEEPAFGLRADGGKIIMCFVSSRKLDILQSIRGAKGKLGKDSKSHKAMDRLVRPQDVPGTLLNLALTNLSSLDHTLRSASYNLLGALCRTFGFDAATRLMCTKDLAIPMDCARFIISISKEIAHTEPRLTSDFLTEFFVAWESFPKEQKPLSLAYMSPWLAGLRTDVLVGETDGEKGREKVATFFRKLIDLTVLDATLTHSLEQLVWPSIARDELLVDIFLGELLKAALSHNTQSDSLDMISSVIVGTGTVTVRAKILSRLRKALNRSSLRPTRHLQDNMVWAEICVLLQFCVALSFDNGAQSQIFFPEICHIATMLANTGTQGTRSLVYKLLVNSMHAMCVSFVLKDSALTKLRANLDLLCEPRGEIFLPASAGAVDGASNSTLTDPLSSLTATENMTALLLDVCFTGAPSADMSNAWRSRWMSLVASTAFQSNPAIQPRAFAVMGYLACEEVDDDLLYQVLVALRNSISQFGENGGSDMLVSIVTALSRMMVKLPPTSRYGLQLFWLALSLVRLVPTSLFNCTVQFLHAVLNNMSTSSEADGASMVSRLLQSRSQLEEATLPLDDAYGIHFDEELFHVAVCACLVRGLTDTATRLTTVRTLFSLFRMTEGSQGNILPSNRKHSVNFGSPYLSLIIARGLDLNDLNDGTWTTAVHHGEQDVAFSEHDQASIGNISDTDVTLISAMQLVDFRLLEDAAQARTLRWLNQLALARPVVFNQLCGAMPALLDNVLVHGQDSSVLNAAHALLHTITSETTFTDAMSSTDSLLELLSKTGFDGLWQSSSQAFDGAVKRECFDLTEKIIELIVI